jgi:hypothetical protein
MIFIFNHRHWSCSEGLLRISAVSAIVVCEASLATRRQYSTWHIGGVSSRCRASTRTARKRGAVNLGTTRYPVRRQVSATFSNIGATQWKLMGWWNMLKVSVPQTSTVPLPWNFELIAVYPMHLLRCRLQGRTARTRKNLIYVRFPCSRWLLVEHI